MRLFGLTAALLVAGCEGGPEQEVDVDLLFFSRALNGANELRAALVDEPSTAKTVDALAGATSASFLDTERVIATVGIDLVVLSLTDNSVTPVATDVVMVGPEGVGDVVISAGYVDPGEPELTEDGEPIGVELDFDLYRLDLTTGATTRLTEGPSFDAAVTVADDGRVFYVSDASGQNELWALDDGTPRQVTTGANLVGRACVSGDGATLVWGQATADGTVLVQASTADGVIRPLGTGVIGVSPAIADDGRVVFSRFEPFAEDQDPVAELFVYDPATDIVTQLTDDGRIASSPALAR